MSAGEVVPVLSIPDLLKSAARVSPVAEAPAAAPVTGKTGKTVLVVEDSITARTLLKNILETAGYNVMTAVDGVDALTALKTAEFDIVVSDIEMPRMSGLDLTARIRSDKRFAELPVVLVTALESREDRERGIDVGLCTGDVWLELCGETNVQAAAMGRGVFIHMELDEDIRKNNEDSLVEALVQVFGH